MIAVLALLAPISLTVRVDGEGYLRFVREGRIVYAASAVLTVDNGLLGAKNLPLAPAIRIPADAVRLEVDLAGNIVAVEDKGKHPCGRLVLARFNKAPINAKDFFTATERASIGNPGDGLFGVIRSAAGTSAGIAINPVSEVSADTFTLGEIAAVDPSIAGTVIGSSPGIGIEMVITDARIKAVLKRAGIDAAVTVPPHAIVRRSAQAIRQEDFITAAIKAAGSELPLVCTQNPGDFKAPLGAVELKGEGVTTSGTNISVTVAVYVDGRRVNARLILLKPDASAQIRAGSPVKIVMKSAGLTVEVGGRARTGGVIGQTISVMTDTGSLLMGKIVGADKVEVQL